MSKKKSLYNEEETIRLCKKYGIEMVEKEGGPLFLGEEMDALSFLDMMDGEIIIETTEVSFSMKTQSVLTQFIPLISSGTKTTLSYDCKEASKDITSSISPNNQNFYAA